MFAVVQEGFVAAFSSDSLLAQNGEVHFLFSIFRSSFLLMFASGCFGAVFCQPAVRPAPSRFVALARNCQVSQGDASQDFVVSAAHWMFLRLQIFHCFFMIFWVRKDG